MAEKFSVLPESEVVPGFWSSGKQHSRVWLVCRQVATGVGRMGMQNEEGYRWQPFGEQMSHSQWPGTWMCRGNGCAYVSKRPRM